MRWWPRSTVDAPPTSPARYGSGCSRNVPSGRGSTWRAEAPTGHGRRGAADGVRETTIVSCDRRSAGLPSLVLLAQALQQVLPRFLRLHRLLRGRLLRLRPLLRLRRILRLHRRGRRRVLRGRAAPPPHRPPTLTLAALLDLPLPHAPTPALDTQRLSNSTLHT